MTHANYLPFYHSVTNWTLTPRVKQQDGAYNNTVAILMESLTLSFVVIIEKKKKTRLSKKNDGSKEKNTA